jgi:DNA-binding XRE family transcriptional regulator
MSYNANLRGLRARWCLSQDELADLLGIDRTRISRYEKNEEAPSLSTALGLQVVFNEQPRRLFHRTYELIEDAVMQRAADLERSLEDQGDYASTRKRHLLDAMMARATNRDEA